MTSLDLPPHFRERMRRLLGAEAGAFFAALTCPSTGGLRVNTLKATSQQLQGLLPWSMTPVPWCPSGFVIEDQVRPGLHPLHAAGLFYLQDPAAMAVAQALAPCPGERILDLAAAPGGKATHLAALSGDAGLLVANDVDPGRQRALMSNLERWGVRRAVITSEQPARLAQRWGAVFDRVLLDAPCSGESMFRKSESARTMWRADVVQGCALRQQHLLQTAAELVRPGGWLVYSTCTFAPEENEHAVARFLHAHPDFALRPTGLVGTLPARPDWLPPELVRADLAHAVRIWPHHAVGDGHFIALLQRVAGTVAPWTPAALPPASRQAREHWAAFVAASLPGDPAETARLTLQANQLYAVPDDLPDLAGMRVARAGLWLGTLQKDRFVPSHSLALALRPSAIGQPPALPGQLDLAPDDERLARYLQGHPLAEPGPSGWVVISVSGFPIGWGRRARGIIKNAYPKGLRRPP